MKLEIFQNIKDVERITLYDQEKPSWLRFNTKKNRFEEYVYWFWRHWEKIDELPNGYYLSDGIVYKEPMVICELKNKSSFLYRSENTKYQDKMDDLKEFIIRIKENVPEAVWINKRGENIA